MLLLGKRDIAWYQAYGGQAFVGGSLHATISTNVPLRPGIAPVTSIKFSSFSTFATFKPETVLLTPPIRLAILWPFNTRCGQTDPMDPGSRWLCFWPCEAGPPAKPCFLTTPCNPFSFVRICVTAQGSASIKVTGVTRPFSSNTCVIPIFRPKINLFIFEYKKWANAHFLYGYSSARSAEFKPNQFSGMNSGKIQGARSVAYHKVRERRATKKLARIRPPSGKRKNG